MIIGPSFHSVYNRAQRVPIYVTPIHYTLSCARIAHNVRHSQFTFQVEVVSLLKILIFNANDASSKGSIITKMYHDEWKKRVLNRIIGYPMQKD